MTKHILDKSIDITRINDFREKCCTDIQEQEQNLYRNMYKNILHPKVFIFRKYR